jgi:membrane-associated phospholipid phosphatase
MKPTDDRRSSETALVLPWRGEVTLPCGRALIAARSLVRAATPSRWREALDACGAFEWVALAYLGLTGALILAFRNNLPGAQVHSSVIAGLVWFAGQAGVAALIVALSWTTERRSSAVLRFVRHWYPQAFFLFCFEELHYLVHLVFPGWCDRWLIGFDHWLAGVHPTVWFEQFARPALNDFMQMAYLSYFFYLPILAGILYARGEVRAFWTVMTSSVAAYTIGYLISIFFPVESPYHSLAALQRVELTGGFFTSLIGVIEHFGRVHGAAFPSAHVSGSLVALLGAWRYRRWLFWTFLPFFLCMLVATVYGRYHYIADVLAGLVVGAIGFGLGHWLMQWRGALPESKARRASANVLT